MTDSDWQWRPELPNPFPHSWMYIDWKIFRTTGALKTNAMNSLRDILVTTGKGKQYPQNPVATDPSPVLCTFNVIHGWSAILLEPSRTRTWSAGYDAPSDPVVLRILSKPIGIPSRYDIKLGTLIISVETPTKSPRTWYCLSEKREKKNGLKKLHHFLDFLLTELVTWNILWVQWTPHLPVSHGPPDHVRTFWQRHPGFNDFIVSV